MSYLRNVDLKFSRHGIQGPNTPRRVFWLVSAALTYLSPALGKEKVNLGDIGPLSTAQRNRLKLHFCPAFFIVESPAGIPVLQPPGGTRLHRAGGGSRQL